ncbi:PAS domain-containing protein [Meridianimarinicoccus roseus]|nr:PAS domain-containing protein [Meridianimarinicoccus roseus]
MTGTMTDVPEAQLVEDLATDLAQGKSDTAGKLFAAHDAPAPLIVWRPTLADAQHPILRSFLRGCGEGGGPLPVSWLDSEAFGALGDWAMVVAPGNEPGDYVYRHYGSKIAEVYQTDMTGRSVFDIGGHVAVFFSALYHAVERRREQVMSVHEPPRQVFVRAWRRIIQPLLHESGELACFAAVNMPDNDLRAGLEVLPEAAMVVSMDGNVCYANRPACLLFGQPRSPLAGMSVQAFTGLDIELPKSPEKLILEGGPRHLRRVMARGSLLVPVNMTIGATYYRDMPLYVISVRSSGT